MHRPPAQAFKYDPYGGSTTTNNSGYSSAYQNPFTFGEGLLDRATGEVKFGQRYYSPVTGTWTQQDALNAPLDPDNADRYAYASDNPINELDATGRDIFDDVTSDISDVASDVAGFADAAGFPQVGAIAGGIADVSDLAKTGYDCFGGGDGSDCGTDLGSDALDLATFGAGKAFGRNGSLAGDVATGVYNEING